MTVKNRILRYDGYIHTRIKKIIKLLKGLVKHFSRKTSSRKETHSLPKPTIIPRDKHTISRKSISPHALKVLYRLHEAGYQAYLVGGCVRDLLLNYTPKDFDVATDARPEEIRKIFRNCRLIGRRFRLAHILFGRDVIEVATFRAHYETGTEEHHTHAHTGMVIRDNVYGTMDEDASRRDFTINALYYNIADFSVVDYTGGMHDLAAHRVRMIGDPDKRYHEDPVRLLRAVRITGKLKLHISPETEEPIIRLSHLLKHVSTARLFQEVLKFLQEGATFETFKLLQKYHLFKQLFPDTAHLLDHPETSKFIHTALKNSDERVKNGKSISPAFLFAVFIWPVVAHDVKKANHETIHYPAIEAIIFGVLKKQKQHLDITKQLMLSIREICMLQFRFGQRRGKQPHRLLGHPRFRAAYDLLLLRAESGEPVHELCEWWTKFQVSDFNEQERMINSLHKERRRKKR